MKKMLSTLITAVAMTALAGAAQAADEVTLQLKWISTSPSSPAARTSLPNR